MRTWIGTTWLGMVAEVLHYPDVNSTAVRPEVPGEVWPEGELPAQGFGDGQTLMPGIDNFQLPLNLPQLWDTKPMKFNRPGHPDHDLFINRKVLKFDKQNPLIIVDGPNKDQTLTGSLSTQPRARGKRDNPQTSWVSDLAYLLTNGCGDKSRPTTPDGLVDAINRYAGRTVRIRHGLSAHCRPDKVRYIQSGDDVIIDPTGTVGCDERYYTKDMKDDQGNYIDEILCNCGAALRAYPTIDEFLAPTGGHSGPVAGQAGAGAAVPQAANLAR